MTSDNFSKMFPESNSNRPRILLYILLILVVIAAIVFYQINKIKVVEEISLPPNKDQNALTQEQRTEAISELRKTVSSSSPVTDKEKAKALEELKKAVNNQK